MDMVCEKIPTSNHDFSKDPIEFVIKDEWLYANNTTLGADNGIGMALSLAILDNDLPHGPLELLFTVDEETGLTGANALKEKFLDSEILLNLDSEDENIYTVGCAGGIQTDVTLELANKTSHQMDRSLEIKVRELRGGHSGVNIGDQRGNAIIILAGVLQKLSENYSFTLVEMEGGTAHNAIPREPF